MSSVHQAEATRAPTFWAAPDLAKAGYPVFPVGLDKEPSVRGGFYAATRDISQIAAWIEEDRADHDIAIPTGLITLTVIVDADTRKAYAQMVATFGEPTVKTDRGGHWYFAHPQDGKVTSRKFAPGLDCKADGGYVIVPLAATAPGPPGSPTSAGYRDCRRNSDAPCARSDPGPAARTAAVRWPARSRTATGTPP
jgi:hypothetical protein